MNQHTLPGLEPEAPVDPPEVVAQNVEDKPFDWFEDREDIIVEAQSSIATYRNRRGHLVVRAEGRDGEDDAYIIISTAHALKALIDRLQRELREGF